MKLFDSKYVDAVLFVVFFLVVFVAVHAMQAEDLMLAWGVE